MKVLATIFAVILMSSSAMADFYLEPYIGYETGKAESSEGKDDLAGTLLGGKIGFDTLGFAGGLDVMTGTLTQKADGGDVDWKNQDLGLFAQFTFPILLKVSGTYFLQSEMKEGGDKLKGSGHKIGVGFTGLPFVSINVDMVNINYDKYEGDAGSGDVDNDRKTWFVSLSLPLSL